MKSSPYIVIGDLNPKEIDKSDLTVRVWRREKISNLLQISESQFVELCLYLGNDFTLDEKNTTIIESKNFIESQSPLFRLTSQNSNLNQAYAFSRKFYELEDLSEFPFDPPFDPNECIGLSDGEKQDLQDWLIIPNHASFNKIGMTAVNFIKSAVSTNEKWKKYFTLAHIDAFSAMLRKLQEDCAPSDRPLRSSYRTPWEDLIAIYLYQLICKFIQKHAEKYFDFTMIDQVFNLQITLTYLAKRFL